MPRCPTNEEHEKPAIKHSRGSQICWPISQQGFLTDKEHFGQTQMKWEEIFISYGTRTYYFSSSSVAGISINIKGCTWHYVLLYMHAVLFILKTRVGMERHFMDPSQLWRSFYRSFSLFNPSLFMVTMIRKTQWHRSSFPHSWQIFDCLPENES